MRLRRGRVSVKDDRLDPPAGGLLLVDARGWALDPLPLLTSPSAVFALACVAVLGGPSLDHGSWSVLVRCTTLSDPRRLNPNLASTRASLGLMADVKDVWEVLAKGLKNGSFAWLYPMTTPFPEGGIGCEEDAQRSLRW